MLFCASVSFLLMLAATIQLSSSFQTLRANGRVVKRESAGWVVSMSTIEEADKTKIFGRLADKMLLLDIPGAGTPEMMNCCHGGCDNCDYSHIFDCMTAARAKWVACYPFRQLIDGRSHDPSWAQLFSDDNGELNLEKAIDEATFIERMQRLQYKMSMGPTASVSTSEPPSVDALKFVWQKVSQALTDTVRGDTSSLTADQFAKGLKLAGGAEHGLSWREFQKLFD